MKHPILPAFPRFRLLARDRRGVTAMLVAVLAPVMFGGAGVAIDIGRAMQAQRTLQGSSDAAAMAGAQFVITDPIQAVASAKSFSSISGGQNATPSFTATMVPGYPALKCFKSTGIICGGTAAANGIVVKQQATVPTYFIGAVGIKTITVATTSTASASGGFAKPLNVEIIVDSTGSMSQSDPNCGGLEKIQCALTGVTKILGVLSPSVDYVGLMTLPGITPATVSADYCGGALLAISQAYWSSNTNSAMEPAPEPATNTAYEIVPLSNDYRTSDAATTLNPSSDLVKATGSAGGSGCHGMQSPAGFGTYYSDIIAVAQAKLVALAATRPNSQNVLIFSSDGDAQSTTAAPGPTVPANTTGIHANQCQEGVTQAQKASTAGTWVFSVAYNSLTSGSCSTDTGNYKGSACAAMQAIASNSTRFFSDNATTCFSTDNPNTGLINAFTTIGQILVPARLIPDNTT